jgi:hypothetical protein
MQYNNLTLDVTPFSNRIYVASLTSEFRYEMNFLYQRTLLQKAIVVLVGNTFMVSVRGTNTICTVQKITHLLYRLERTDMKNQFLKIKKHHSAATPDPRPGSDEGGGGCAQIQRREEATTPRSGEGRRRRRRSQSGGGTRWRQRSRSGGERRW